MRATLILPDQAPQPVSPYWLEQLAPHLYDGRNVGGTLPPHLTANTWAAGQVLGVDTGLVDVLSSTAEHLVLCVFDSTTARNQQAEQLCTTLGVADFIGDGDGDAGHLFGPFLIIEASQV